MKKASPAAAQSSHNIRWFRGLTEAPVTYFEVIETRSIARRRSLQPPLLWPPS